jgi:hypothetical protein
MIIVVVCIHVGPGFDKQSYYFLLPFQVAQ